jgi:hypothetical protein
MQQQQQQCRMLRRPAAAQAATMLLPLLLLLLIQVQLQGLPSLLQPAGTQMVLLTLSLPAAMLTMQPQQQQQQ